jgi:hypothetical protein
MKNPLMPEKRLDKNGRLVTKHVRAGGVTDKTGNRSFPAPYEDAPKSSIQNVVDQQMALILNAADNQGMGFFGKRKMLKSLDPSTLTTLAKHGVGMNYYLFPTSLVHYSIETQSLSLLNDLAAYADDYGGFDEGFYRGCAPALYLLGLTDGVRDKSIVTYSKASPEERARQHAVIQAVRTLDAQYIVETSGNGSRENGVPQKKIINPELKEYIRKNPDKVEAVVNLINERGSDILEDENVMDGLVESYSATATPLSGGAL